MKSTNGVFSLQTNVDRQKEQQHEQGLGVVAEGGGVPVHGLGQGGVEDVEPHRRVPWLQLSTNIRFFKPPVGYDLCGQAFTSSYCGFFNTRLS